MYESYWQLKRKPFDSTADPDFYFPGESFQAALLKLRYAIENRRGGALLTGPPGVGKTLVAGMLKKMLGDEFQPLIHLVFPQMPTAELLGYLADELDSSDPATRDDSVRQSVRRIERFLADNTQRDRHTVVIIDEAHLVENSHTLEAIRLLMNFQPAGQQGLTLLLVGQTSLIPTLQRIPQLEERLAVKSLLRALSEQETADYVAHRLKVAGAVRPIFEPEAMPALYTLTHGIARQINRLCDLALLIGFAEEQKAIGVAHLEAVAEELVAVVPE